MPNVVTKNIRCAAGMPAVVAIPAGTGTFPAIVLMHERYGLVQHSLDLAQRFAREGFVCITPDFFFRFPDQDGLHRGDVGYPLGDTEAIELLNIAIDELAKMPEVDASKIAVKGVCQTGRHPVLIAAERPIAAALVWYGAASEREWSVSERFTKPFDDIVKRISCPVLGIFGEGDHVVSLDDVRRFRDLLDHHDKSYTIKIYRDVPHGWLNDTMPGRYRRDAAEAAWALQRDFLKQVLDPGYDKTRVVQVYESDHARNYDFTKNVRME